MVFGGSESVLAPLQDGQKNNTHLKGCREECIRHTPAPWLAYGRSVVSALAFIICPLFPCTGNSSLQEHEHVPAHLPCPPHTKRNGLSHYPGCLDNTETSQLSGLLPPVSLSLLSYIRLCPRPGPLCGIPTGLPEWERPDEKTNKQGWQWNGSPPRVFWNYPTKLNSPWLRIWKTSWKPRVKFAKRKNSMTLQNAPTY